MYRHYKNTTENLISKINRFNLFNKFFLYLLIFYKILDAIREFCYTESSYKEGLSNMMDINYELYKVFYYVAISLSFSDASKQLFISQSAVSQSIKVLEKKLGITLFIRSTKRVQLTPEGETLLRHIEPAMNLIKRGEAQLMEASNLGGGQLRIGASDTICRYYLVPFLNKFHKTYPNVHIKVTNQTSTKCVDLLEMGQVDLIVTNYPNSRLSHGDHIRTIHSFKDCFIASSRHYKELMGKKLHLKDLLEYPIGLGIAFVPDYCIPDDGELFPLDIQEELPGRTLVIAHNPQLPLTKAAKEFLNIL